MKRIRIALLALITCSFSPEGPPPAMISVAGIDHIPIVVKDLESTASSVYNALGFSLKPGRVHPNGITNQHVKFADGTELELITASEGKDALSAEYVTHLKEGEGPLYFGLFSIDIPRIARQLDSMSIPYEREPGMLGFPVGHPCHPLFFGSRNLSPTDKPEYFAHRNTAFNLSRVWLAADLGATYESMFYNLGIATQPRKVFLPPAHVAAQVALLPEGEVILVPAEHQIVRGHIVIGATVQVKSMDTLVAILKQSGIEAPPIVYGKDGSRSLTLSPGITHGLWLEFSQTSGKRETKG